MALPSGSYSQTACPLPSERDSAGTKTIFCVVRATSAPDESRKTICRVVFVGAATFGAVIQICPTLYEPNSGSPFNCGLSLTA